MSTNEKKIERCVLQTFEISMKAISIWIHFEYGFSNNQFFIEFNHLNKFFYHLH